MAKVSYCNVYVDDQDQAKRFYCDVLGFVIKHDIPIGEHRWLTVIAPETRRDRSCCSSPMCTRP